MSDNTSYVLQDGMILPSQLALVLAVLCPTLLAFNLAPSSTFFNQAAAFVGWGVALLVLPSAPRRIGLVNRHLWLLLLPLGILLVEAGFSLAYRGLPSSLALSAMGVLAAAAIATLAGAQAGQSNRVDCVFKGFCWALLAAGLAGGVLGCIQVFAPDLADGVWVAVEASDGRASGNLRQPNHLSSLLVWAVVALVWLRQSQSVPSVLTWPLGAFMVFGIVLTGSRTGLLDVGLLAAWGVLDRRLPRQLRLALVALPLLYAAVWWGMRDWAHSTGNVFGGEARMGAQGDISSSRYAIWSDTAALIRENPWFGVGFGEFNFAWTLTPFPHRPVAFFDHTHNIALQFAVELGTPIAVLLVALLLAAMVLAFRNSARLASPVNSSIVRTASMVVAMIGVHSMFEYPLWYVYFLLPCAFAFGLALSVTEARPKIDVNPRGGLANANWVRALGLALLLGGLFSLLDYFQVVPIFEAGGGRPLNQRIEAGRHSVFFSHHADYAAVTTASSPVEQFTSFATATHNLLDTRLMIAWAKAYAERGDVERARHIAARLREFRNADAAEFFGECESRMRPPPFQCEMPTQKMDHRDFR